MARYNEILAGRYNRFLQKHLGMKGEPPAPQLSTEITTSYELFAGKENRLHQGWFHYYSLQQLAGVAATNVGFRWRNPGGSGGIAVIERIEVQGNTANTAFTMRLNSLDVGMATLNSAAVIRGEGRQGLATSGARSILQLTFDNLGAIPGNDFIIWNPTIVAANDRVLWNYIESHEIILAPSDSLDIINSSQNQLLQATVSWRERALEESERTA